MKSGFARCFVSTYPYGYSLNKYIHQHILLTFLYLFFYGPYQKEMYFTSVFCTNSQELTRPELSAWKETSHDRKPSSLLEFYSFKSKRLLKCNLRENAFSQLQRKRKKGTSSKGMALNSTSALDLWGQVPCILFPLPKKKGCSKMQDSEGNTIQELLNQRAIKKTGFVLLSFQFLNKSIFQHFIFSSPHYCQVCSSS